MLTARELIHGEKDISPIGTHAIVSRLGSPSLPLIPSFSPSGGEGVRRAADVVSEDWLLWQLADSAFPTGGFAHSGGLEAACQHGEVRGSAELEEFMRASLMQLGRGMLPLMTAAYDRPERLVELDDWCHAFLTNHVANRASRLQGRALFASATRIFGQTRLEETQQWGECPAGGHLAPVFGILARALKLERTRAARLFLFWHLRGWVAGAVRLGAVGPLEAQGVQFGLRAYAEEVLNRCAGLGLDEIAQTGPLLDVWQGSQDRLYSRLFQS